MDKKKKAVLMWILFVVCVIGTVGQIGRAHV